MCIVHILMYKTQGPSWSWTYGSWIYNYLCNQCLSSLTLWVRISLWQGVPDTTLCDKVCQWLVSGRWFSPVSSTDCHDIAEILLKVVLNTITLNPLYKTHLYHDHFNIWLLQVKIENYHNVFCKVCIDV